MHAIPEAVCRDREDHPGAQVAALELEQLARVDRRVGRERVCLGFGCRCCRRAAATDGARRGRFRRDPPRTTRVVAAAPPRARLRTIRAICAPCPGRGRRARGVAASRGARPARHAGAGERPPFVTFVLRGRHGREREKTGSRRAHGQSMRAGKRGNFAHDFTSTARTMILTQRAACAKPLALDAPRRVAASER